jgi:glycosyltransferase involved in cell wall biosynthesis
MRIAVFTTFAGRGGAPAAMRRLVKGLRARGHHVDIFCLDASRGDPDSASVRRIPLEAAAADFVDALQQIAREETTGGNRTELSNTFFSLPLTGYRLTELGSLATYDAINIHWVAQFLSIGGIAEMATLGRPMLFTLHDMLAFTGGCHYSAGCRGFTEGCAKCPQLAQDPYGLPAIMLAAKRRLRRYDNLAAVAPSRWMRDCAADSGVFAPDRCFHINNAIEAEIYHPIDKAEAKASLGIAPDARTILLGADDNQELRKGFRLALAALTSLSAMPTTKALHREGRFQIIVFGRGSPHLEEAGFPVHHLGHIGDDHRMALAYSAADVLVLPSLEDNQPNIMLEAMACGTPVVSFAVGGMRETISDGLTGRLIAPYDAEALAQALAELVRDPEALGRMGAAARDEMVKNFTLDRQAVGYESLFEDLRKERTRSGHGVPGGLPVSGRSDGICVHLDVDSTVVTDELISALEPRIRIHSRDKVQAKIESDSEGKVGLPDNATRRLSGVFRGALKLSWRVARARSLKPLRLWRQARLVARSGKFDAAWYLNTYPDIAATGANPLEHYLNHGVAEGRNPSADFDTEAYLRRNPDVARLGLNPLVHYVTAGVAEGRQTAKLGDGAKSTSLGVLSEIRASVNPSDTYEALDPTIAAGVEPAVKAIALYLPQFHSVPENDEWWGTGFTDWRNVVRGAPRFTGHYQPRIPRDLGFYDLSNPEVVRRQIQLAKAAGLYGFCYCFYWVDGKRLLEKPVEQFLVDSSLDFPFCIMWMNENSTRRRDGLDSDGLIAQSYGERDELSLLEEFQRHFSDSRYIRINGRPLLIISRPALIPNTVDTLRRWKEYWRTAHGDAPLLVGVHGFGMDDPREFGLDGALEFPPHGLAEGLEAINAELDLLDPAFSGSVYRYNDVAKRSLARTETQFPLIRSVFPAWDNDARRQGNGSVYHGSTPLSYERWLREVAQYAIRNPVWNRSFVFINAWNNWAEAAYLEPDVRYGSAYLNATARALTSLPGAKDSRGAISVLLIGDDASDHGTQRDLRTMGEVLVSRFGVAVEFVRLEGGPLLPSYRRIAPYTLLSSGLPGSARLTFLKLYDKGYRFAIASTTVTGEVIAEAKSVGLKVLSLVDELPDLIGHDGLPAVERAIVESSDEIVFASSLLRDKFRELNGAGEEHCHVWPPALYRKETAPDLAARARVRAELNLPTEARIVLSIGHGHRGAGFDLFARMAQKLCATHVDLYFVWIGPIAPDKTGLHVATSASERPTPRMLALGQPDDVRDYYNAADLFMLMSSDDAFSFVALEALGAGLPVVAFSGIRREELIARHGCVVPIDDLDAACAAVQRELGTGRATGEAAEARRHEVAAYFDYVEYCFWILQRLSPALRRVSVVVPNYDHERYLADRLSSIFRQHYPVYEVIVLDDASTDRSLDVIESAARAAGREIRLEVNAHNAGRLPNQWRKGLALCGGDYVWIAESDDVCDEAFLGEAVAAAEKSGAGLCFCDSWQIDGEGRKIGSSYIVQMDDIEPGTFLSDFVMPGQQFLEKFLSVKNVIMNMSGVLWRRSALTAALAGAGPEIDQFKLAADWRLYVEACRQNNSVAYITRSLNGHRRHGKGITLSLDRQLHLEEVQRMQALVADMARLGADRQSMARQHIREAKRYLGLADAQGTTALNTRKVRVPKIVLVALKYLLRRP